jgi:hypothetical protein
MIQYMERFNETASRVTVVERPVSLVAVWEHYRTSSFLHAKVTVFLVNTVL